jgi:hypothetical protein
MTSIKPTKTLALSLTIASLSACGAPGEETAVQPVKTAHFRVTEKIINPDVQPFTATIGGFGNSVFTSGTGFEPVVYRNSYIATRDAPDRIVARPEDIGHWDTLREGALDGATVRIYRIENGKFRLVRQDKVPSGGFHASSWLPVLPKDTVVAPDQAVFRFRWSEWNRPEVPYYFAVCAVDANGKLSPISNVVSVQRPAQAGKGEPINSTRPLKNLNGAEGSLPAPTGLKGSIEADHTLRLEWQPVADERVAGYLVYRADAPPDAHRGYSLQLAGSPSEPEKQIKKGDLAIIEKKFYDASRNRYHSNRVWGAGNENQLFKPGLVPIFSDEDPGKTWQLIRHGDGTPVAEAGETFLRLQLADGKTLALGEYSYSGTGQHWYEVLDTKAYRVDVWLRRQGGGKVTFNVLDYYSRADHKIEPIEFLPTENWQRFTATFIPPQIQPGNQPGRIVLEISGPGSFDIDNLRVYRADTDFLDYTEKEYADLRQSGMQALRTHGLIKTQRRTYDLEQLTNPAGVNSLGYGAKGNTLPQTLAMMRKAGMRPWLQIEPHLSPEEWGSLVEYIAAPYRPGQDTPAAKPWAWKRFLQGQVKPWADEFDRIYLELGNETWNGLFRPWVFTDMVDAATGKRYTAGQVYGLYQEFVIARLRASPWWQAARLDDKVEFVLGGWSGFSYGSDAASTSPSSQHLTVAAYLGGWDIGEQAQPNVPASFHKLLNVAGQIAPRIEKHALEVRALNSRIGKELKIGTYEAGPGYALNGLNNERVTPRQAAEQEEVKKSLASGVATLDVFLSQAAHGYQLQNFFTFAAGDYWKSHARWYDGGQAYPAWKALASFNQHATGAMIATKTLEVPQIDLQSAKTSKITRVPAVAAYATRNKNRVAVILISRKMAGYPDPDDSGFTPVSVDLPFRSAQSITLHRMSGEATAHNLHADNVTVETLPLSKLWRGQQLHVDPSTGGAAQGLPPSSVFLYVFEGVDADTARPPRSRVRSRQVH